MSSAGTAIKTKPQRQSTAKVPPPGPRLPTAVQTPYMFWRTFRFAERYQKRYGDCFQTKIYPFGKLIMISDPALIKAVFTENRGELRAGEGNATPQVFQSLMGPASLLLLDGREHLDNRRLMSPPFHGEQMKIYEQLMVDVTLKSLQSWPKTKAFSLRDKMQEITLEIILRAVFGIEESSKLELFSARITSLLKLLYAPSVDIPFLRYQFGPIGSWKSFQEARRSLDDLLDQEIEQRRNSPHTNKRSDVLSRLIEARFGGLSNAQLRDQVMTLLVAGHETTATALAWTFELLFRNPTVMERLQLELGEQKSDYLDATIKESLRIRPVLDFALRKATATVELGDYLIPAGSVIGVNIWSTHHDPRNYPDPDKFKPERFLEARPDTYTWLPFGGGIRRCLGASFASFEMATVLKTVFAQVKLQPASLKPEAVAKRSITLGPKHGARAVIAG